MLNKSVCNSKKFQDLPDDTCRLLATWIISHLDIHGVFYANTQLVRSLVFPRRDDVSNAQVAEYLDAMAEIELIVRFESNGETWQYWPGFEHNQIGIRYDRESSDFPLPPGWEPPKQLELVPPNAGQNPAEVKLSEVKKKKNVIRAAESPAVHPAIDVYRSKARRYPDRAQWPSIEQCVKRDDDSLALWGRVVEAYILCGWNKINISGMIDWYKRGEIPHTARAFNGNGNGQHKPTTKLATSADVDAEFARLNPKAVKK